MESSTAKATDKLLKAAAADDRDRAEEALKAGANVNGRSGEDGLTALHWAAMNGNTRMGTLLIDYHADLNAKSHVGQETALYYASPKLSEILLAHGADPNVKNHIGATPMHTTASRGQVELARVLIAKDVDINAVDNYGQTPLHWAARAGQLEMVQLLIDKGARLDARDYHNKTPQETAKSFGHKRSEHVLAQAAGLSDLPSHGILQTGKRQWVATLPSEDGKEHGR